MKIALVHDHLVQDGGAEKVLLALQEVFPGAPTFTLLYDRNRVSREFASRDIRTSFLQGVPFGLKKYQWMLPLMPAATEAHDLSQFDVVISSSSAFAKGVITRPGTVHICYCHTPTRYLWSDTHSYVQELKAPRLLKAGLPFLLNKLRVWDRLSADRVDRFIANSATVAGRIRKYYERPSDIIHPPVETEKFSVSDKPGTYFLAGGRLVSYKRFDLVIQAFNRTGLPLKIFGDGPLAAEYRKSARSNIEFAGKVDDAAKAELYRNAIAFIHPQEEDFGITALESMASGRPVIAYRKGGALETVVEGVTGEFFDDQEWEELATAVIRFDASRYDARAIRAHAEAFDVKAFKRRIAAYVAEAWKASKNSVIPSAAEEPLAVRERQAVPPLAALGRNDAI
ncbi:MAG TPA: glycosyltransferase [Candidatus Baltobacteraceae bacterium]|nr:glycosyltransferase [Candidatus Baltobacteraceae bacterium]